MIYIIPNYFENGIKFEKELDQFGIVVPISVRVSGTYPYYIIHLMKRFLKLLKENCRQADENTIELFGKLYNNISTV